MAWGRPISTRIPLSGSSVSSTDADADRAPPLEDDDDVLRALVAMPARPAARVDLDLAEREGVGPEVAGLDEDPHPGAGSLDHARPLAPPHRLALGVPGPQDVARPFRWNLDGRQQGQRIDRGLVAHDVVLGRSLVQDVAGADHDAPLELGSVLEDDLAGGEVDERLEAVPVRPDLDAGRDPIELQPDAHARPPAA